MNPGESEGLSLLGSGESPKPPDKPTQSVTTTSAVQLAVNNFVEELEDIFVNTDKLLIRDTEQTIPSSCIPESTQLAKVYEVLDGKGNPGFLLGRCQESNRTLQFVLYLRSRGSGVLRLKYYGIFDQHCEIDGAGILKFRQVSGLLGYILEDDYKKLLKINLGCAPFCSCFMGGDINMSFLNLDGTPSGSMSCKSWPELGINDKVFGVHFIPNLDRKAKYMLLASSLLPFKKYFS